MSGLTYSSRQVQGLRYISRGNGCEQDWELHKARKAYRCEHQGPHNSRRGAFALPCQHSEINPGAIYVLTRQSQFESARLSLDCAIAAGVYEWIADA